MPEGVHFTQETKEITVARDLREVKKKKEEAKRLRL
jgi:hypothetical protein